MGKGRAQDSLHAASLVWECLRDPNMARPAKRSTTSQAGAVVRRRGGRTTRVTPVPEDVREAVRADRAERVREELGLR